MQTYHRKGDIPDFDQGADVPEEHNEPLSAEDEKFLDELIDRRKRKIRRICVSPASSAESVVVTAIVGGAGDGDVSVCRRRDPSACHCATGAPAHPTTGHNMFGGMATQPMRPMAAQQPQQLQSRGSDELGGPPSDNDTYSMFGDHRNMSSYDAETLTRWSSSLFNWVYGLFGAVVGLAEHIVKTPVLLGLTLATIFLLMIAVQIEILISYLIEEFLNVAYPAFHGYLLLLEKWFMGAAHSTAAFNDLSQATFCDTADRWCTQYGLLCEQRCSFARIAAERVRGNLR